MVLVIRGHVWIKAMGCEAETASSVNAVAYWLTIVFGSIQLYLSVYYPWIFYHVLLTTTSVLDLEYF
jgi:hypothetical protein